jgi:hypothetical protein
MLREIRDYLLRSAGMVEPREADIRFVAPPPGKPRRVMRIPRWPRRRKNSQ